MVRILNFLPSAVASHEAGAGGGRDRIGRRRDDGAPCRSDGLGQGLCSRQTGEGGSFRRTQVRDDGDVDEGLIQIPSWF